MSFFLRHFAVGSCQEIYLNCAAVLLKKKMEGSM